MKIVQTLLIVAFLGGALLKGTTAFAQKEKIRTSRMDSKRDTFSSPDQLGETTEEFQPGQDIEISGLVVDQTLTKAGRDFYEIFYNGWQSPTNSASLNINIKEIPWPGRVQLTRISVFIGENEVVALPLQPRYDVVEQSAKYAIGRAYEFVANYEQIQRDLQSEDMQGTGIY